MREIVDPSPSRQQINELWRFFGRRCAYCGTELQRAKKEGHVDHLVSASKGGPNHISNRVLSCATCNEKEKLDSAWEGFLKRKATSQRVFAERKQRILSWQLRNPPPEHAPDPSVFGAVDAMAQEVAELFDSKVRLARTLRTKKQ